MTGRRLVILSAGAAVALALAAVALLAQNTTIECAERATESSPTPRGGRYLPGTCLSWSEPFLRGTEAYWWLGVVAAVVGTGLALLATGRRT